MNRRDFLLAVAAALGVVVHEPLAYVTADAESHVVVVGMTSGAVYRRVETLPSPFSIERVGGTAVVAHTVSGRVTVLDRHVIDGLGEPRYTAAAAIAVVDVADPRRPRLAGHVRPRFPAHDVGFAPSGRVSDALRRRRRRSRPRDRAGRIVLPRRLPRLGGCG